MQAAAAAADAAKVTLDLAQRQSQAGYAGYLALLSAEQAYQQGRINPVSYTHLDVYKRQAKYSA